MKVEVRRIYKFSELSVEARGRVIARERQSPWRGTDWAEEWRDSLKKASEYFGFMVRDYSVGGGRAAFCDIVVPEHDDCFFLRYVRLWKWLRSYYHPEKWGDCMFTGVSMDECFLAPVRRFLERPWDVSWGDLLAECAYGWVRGWEVDVEEQMSEEYIRREFECDDGERFLENGDEAWGCG